MGSTGQPLWTTVCAGPANNRHSRVQLLSDDSQIMSWPTAR